MANSSFTLPPKGSGSLCTNCSRMFQGKQYIDTESVLMSSCEIDLIDPQSCCICLFVLSQHARPYPRGPEETSKLVKITYYYLHEIAEDDYNKAEKAFFMILRLNLHNANGRSTTVELAMTPAHRM